MRSSEEQKKAPGRALSARLRRKQSKDLFPRVPCDRASAISRAREQSKKGFFYSLNVAIERRR